MTKHSDEFKNSIKADYEAGLSMGVIAKKYQLTRNAVSGILNRLDVWKTVKREKLVKRQYKRAQRTIKLTRNIEPAQNIEPAWTVGVEGVAFMDCKRWECRWLVGPQLCCGQPVWEQAWQPYCEQHQLISSRKVIKTSRRVGDYR